MHANDLCWPLFSLRARCFGALNHILAVRCGLLDAASGCVFSDFYSVQWGMSVFLDFFNASRYCTRAPPPLSRTNAQDVHSIKLRKTNTNYSICHSFHSPLIPFAGKHFITSPCFRVIFSCLKPHVCHVVPSCFMYSYLLH